MQENLLRVQPNLSVIKHFTPESQLMFSKLVTLTSDLASYELALKSLVSIESVDNFDPALMLTPVKLKIGEAYTLLLGNLIKNTGYRADVIRQLIKDRIAETDYLVGHLTSTLSNTLQ